MRGNVGKLRELSYNRYMRLEQITYPGAYHHVMNRGYDGNDIFFGNQNISQFLLKNIFFKIEVKRKKWRDFKILDNGLLITLPFLCYCLGFGTSFQT